MKKLFFFKSSSSGNNNAVPPRSTNKQICWESSSKSGLYTQAHGRADDFFRSLKGWFSKSRKQVFCRDILVSSTRRTLTPEKQRQSSILNSHKTERPCPASYSSRRTLDGEQQPEKSESSKISQRHYVGNGNYDTAPNSPTNGVARDNPRAHSFREAKGKGVCFSSEDCKENGFGHESPRSLAKSAIERLSQMGSKEVRNDNTITIEDIYAGSVNECCDPDPDEAQPKSYSLDEPHRMADGYHSIDDHRFQKHDVFEAGNSDGLSCVHLEEDADAELRKLSKEAEERVTLLSKEFQRESFLFDGGFDMSLLSQMIRNLEEERLSLAQEVSGLLQSRIADRASAGEELRSLKAEMELRTRRLEKEKHEMQSGLEKELDKRSRHLLAKLEKCPLEEQRLRERCRELAVSNVSLQREVLSFSDRETEAKKLISCSDHQLKEITKEMEEMKEQNLHFQQYAFELQQKCKRVEENRDIYQRNYEEKEKECKELRKSITRLQRSCSELEMTLTGLQDAFSEDFMKNQSMERIDKHVAKMQIEQMRLARVELALRTELVSYRVEADSLRHDNISLLNCLKGNGKGSIAATYKLDNELLARVSCLQDQGLKMLDESYNLCSKLIEFIKGKGGQLHQDSRKEMDAIMNGLDRQFIFESDNNIQTLKSGIEGLTRSLPMMSGLLLEKSSSLTSKLAKLNDQSSEEIIRAELKAECLVTSLLREKLYSKELQFEQMQAELATAVRGNDVLKSEVKNAPDNYSCVNLKLKDLEFQMLKKDESINSLQNDLQESMRELTIMRGMLPKVSEERDIMWEKVKQYNEQNTLLNSEVNVLKKKIEDLDEDILLKEGQITILKDSLRERPFDPLRSPYSMNGFSLC